MGQSATLKDTTSANAKAISGYIKGRITKEKLGFFARVDSYNPDSKYNNTIYTSYKGLTGNYEPNNKERFLSVGFDYSPANNIHFTPNIWYDKYIGQRANLTGKAAHDHDLVYRLTFYFTFGKLFQNPKYSYYPFSY